MQAGRKLRRQLPMLAMLGLCGWVAGCGGKDSKLYSPPGSNLSRHPPAVRIIVPEDGAKFHAHGDIRIVALATSYGTSLGPDDSAAKMYSGSKWELVPSRDNAYSVEFFAGTNSLNLQTASMVMSRVRQRPGQATPMIMGLVGYPAVEWVWHDPPAGTYALTATVTNEAGASTGSVPVNVTVLP